MFFLVSGKREGEAIRQWIVNICQTQEEAESKAARHPHIWVSTCQDWQPEEIGAGYRSLLMDDVGAESHEHVMVKAARTVGWHGNRDATLILIAYRHGSRALRQLQRDYPDSPYLFVSERGAAMAADTARGIVERAGQLAGILLPVHPHMLRHACGFYLASHGHDTRAIQAYLGHKNIQHTVRYTELAPGRFKDFWLD